MKKVYKIFDVSIDTKTGEHYPKTLFHGIAGSRRLPVGKWIHAEEKLVTDGSRQVPYLSGIHAYEDLEAVKKWLVRAKNFENRVVVPVLVRGCSYKPNAVRRTILAKHVFIEPKEWKNRQPVSKYL